MLLAPRLHVVLSGALGFGISNPLDCSVFALETSHGLVLFDAGAGLDSAGLRRILDGLPGPISHLFLTHAHADHSAGAADMRALGASVVAAEATAAIVSRADEDAMSLTVARRRGMYPHDFRARPCPVDRIVTPEDVVRLGDVSVRMVPTPGHSADHVSYVVDMPGRTLLIVGDALFEGGRIVLQDTWDCDVRLSCQSVRDLGQVAFDVFLPGHGPVRLAEGRQPVEAALGRVDRLLSPELFV